MEERRRKRWSDCAAARDGRRKREGIREGTEGAEDRMLRVWWQPLSERLPLERRERRRRRWIH